MARLIGAIASWTLAAAQVYIVARLLELLFSDLLEPPEVRRWRAIRPRIVAQVASMYERAGMDPEEALLNTVRSWPLV